jgi:N-acetyl sugar amidotransferase
LNLFTPPETNTKLQVITLNYCKRCILPDTRPGIWFDEEGICSGCRGQDYKDHGINWEERRSWLDEIVAEAKAKNADYDCVVPVSGGKDSWYQIIKCQEMGLKCLAITWRTPGRTEIGQLNVDNMISKLGVDHIDFTIDPDIERRFMKLAFERVGDPGLPMHMAIFVIPQRLALQLQIPLVVWGENPQLEFGGTEKERMATDLDGDWMGEHGCMKGTNADDWITDELSARDLSAYRLPRPEDFRNSRITPKSIWLGAFLKWNSFENTEIAQKYGFEFEKGGERVGAWDFADIDCDFVSLHHLPKWQKFGMTRAFDNLSVQIRYGLLTRDEAIENMRSRGLDVPYQDVRQFCEFADVPESWFWETLEKYRNHDIWRKDGNVWKLQNFLIDDWDWSEPDPDK